MIHNLERECHPRSLDPSASFKRRQSVRQGLRCNQPSFEAFIIPGKAVAIAEVQDRVRLESDGKGEVDDLVETGEGFEDSGLQIERRSE